MPTDFLVSRVQEVAESWKRDHVQAMKCHDLQDKIRNGLVLFQFYRLADESYSRRVMEGEPINPEAVRSISEAYRSWLAPVEAVRKALAEIEADYPVDGADEFRKAVRLARKFASLDVDTVISSAQEIERGDLIPLGDISNDLSDTKGQSAA